MSDPTRTQIESTITTPVYTVEYWNGSSWVSILPQYVGKITGAAESAGGDTGLAFGAEATATARIPLAPEAASITWRRTRVRVRFGFATSNRLVRVAGIVKSRSRDTDGFLVWDIAGFDEVIARTPIYSPLLQRRPASTATTATSVEDPGAGGYAAGLVNYIFWQSGGRPLAQAASYPDAIFYYACDTALIAPEWSWCAGENGWDELGRLGRACGLVIFQAADGTMTARHALNLGGTGSYTFTRGADGYGEMSEEESAQDQMAAVRVRYTTRRLQPEQVIYEDTNARVLDAFGVLNLTLEMQQPIYDYVLASGTLPSDAITTTTTEARVVQPTVTIVQAAAARLQLTITNPDADTLIISRIAIRGRPIAPTEEGMVVIGSGTPEREIGSDTGVYVQSRGHARQIGTLERDICGTPRPTRTIRRLGYDPDRVVGEAVKVTDAVLGLTDHPHRITAIRHEDAGATMEVDVVPTDGLPTLAEVFVIGQSYSAGDTRKFSY